MKSISLRFGLVSVGLMNSFVFPSFLPAGLRHQVELQRGGEGMREAAA